MNVTGALKLLNDTVELDFPGDEGVYGSIQYGAFGADGITASTGTVVLEGTNDGKNWFVIAITPAGGGAAVLLLAAVGLAWAVCPFDRIRARMSVVGGAQGVQVTCTAKIST
jgi:hypothetical protein